MLRNTHSVNYPHRRYWLNTASRAGVALLCLAALSLADTVELKTGERIEGAFKQATAAGAVIEVGGQPVTFPLEKVRAVYFGATAQSVPSARGEALDALKALQSVTNSGINYRDYSARVLDAKVKVDKYAGSDNAPDPSLQLAMRYYELASLAWGARIASDSVRHREVGIALREPQLAECPSVKTLIAESDADMARDAAIRERQKMTPQNRAAANYQLRDYNVYLTGARVGDRPGIIWSCAEAAIGRAELRTQQKP